MKIKLSDIREFLKRSSKIKTNGVVPVYDFILIEADGETLSLAKSNGNAYCKHTIESADEKRESFLVEEKRLTALVNHAKGEFMHFQLKGNSIIIKDDVNKTTLTGEDVTTFPKFPSGGDAERTILNPEVLISLFEAGKFASIIESNFGYVYAQEKDGMYFVMATNKQVLYKRFFEERLPYLALLPETCAMISGFPHVEYYSAGNYDCFDTGATLYGFVKTEYKAPDISPILAAIDESRQIKVSKEEVVSFCELVNSLAVQKFPVATFESANGGLLMSYTEPEYSVDTARRVDAEINFDLETFHFNASNLHLIFKVFQTEHVLLSPANGLKIYGFQHPEEAGLQMALALVLKPV